MLKQGNMGFVAQCPTDHCGYLGMSARPESTIHTGLRSHLVRLSRIFEGGNMPTMAYPRRGELHPWFGVQKFTGMAARRQ